MKRALKKTIGLALITAGCGLPSTRPIFKKLGLRCAHRLFGGRTVTLPDIDSSPLKLANVDDSYLAFQLFWHGVNYYEPITRALLCELLEPGATFLDLGAHLGFFSLTAGVRKSDVDVIAFEPNPKNLRCLKANAAANGLKKIVCEPLAISETEGTATLYLAESDMSASLVKGFQAEDTRQVGELSVQTTTLDRYLSDHSVRDPLVIKIDIEGHERAFFRGAKRAIATRKPDMILEVLNAQDPESIALLKGLGYRFYPITDRGLTEIDAPDLVKRFPFLFLNHLISVRPKEELALIYARVLNRTRNINLLETSKHFRPDEWPDLWPLEAKQAHVPRAAKSLLTVEGSM
jgi:FkbM family methyltransferase